MNKNMTKRNNKKTPEPMFVGTEPEEMANHINPEVMTENLQGFSQVSPIVDVTDYFFSEEEPKPETDDGTRPEQPAEHWIAKGVNDYPSKEVRDFAEKVMESTGGKFPTERVAGLFTPIDGGEILPDPTAGEKEYKHPFDPINDLHYQLNNAIQPLVDAMQKIIRDPYKASEVMSTTHFNYMVKEYGYLHSFLELSHKLIKERLRERV